MRKNALLALAVCCVAQVWLLGVTPRSGAS